MTTLAEFCLGIARKMGDVVDGTATSGGSGYLIDPTNLTQTTGYWDGGTVWILSGTHAGKVAVVSSFNGNKINFGDFGSTVGTAKYAVARGLIPYRVLVAGANQALDELKLPAIDESILATDAVEYTLPDGVDDVVMVEQVEDGVASLSSHWHLNENKLIFDSAPGGTLRITYLGRPAALAAYGDAVPKGVNQEWLRWAAMVNCLRWANRAMQNDPAYDYGEYLNEAYKRMGELKPYRRTLLRLRTA